MDTYTYYTDGAATMINQKGKYLREAGGWAFIQLKNSKEASHQAGGCPLTTNNEMELYAIYASMKDFSIISAAGDELVICSDSSYCIDIFTKWAKNWQKNGWRRGKNKPIQNLDIIKTIWNLMAEINDEGCNIVFIKVKGHSHDRLNIKVDKLAVEAKKIAKRTGKTVGYNGQGDRLLGSKKN
ncbi:ribonuclease H [uncultured Methanobrevibacter sp.]|uniref:ribonuclease H family protein n=1 Tax=uncultured Methanobrevibacter sp. TaxID=253161 RepID=UPI0026271036|nr:ribonuclease H [uncultured Methanobrevibacter sp.]